MGERTCCRLIHTVLLVVVLGVFAGCFPSEPEVFPDVPGSAVNSALTRMEDDDRFLDGEVAIDKEQGEILLTLTVEPGTGEERAKEMGRSLAWALSHYTSMYGELEGETPDVPEEGLGSLYDAYDLEMIIRMDPDHVVAWGFKPRGVSGIQWRW